MGPGHSLGCAPIVFRFAVTQLSTVPPKLRGVRDQVVNPIVAPKSNHLERLPPRGEHLARLDPDIDTVKIGCPEEQRFGSGVDP